ncbi:ATP-dependent endonuclease [Spirosoma sp. 209]|uniref:ATP-dependent nuclease n=1 Tax=Spirosoma sp. 209 TaxID=1955701 RepID=UPI00098CF82F|nr:AAA family ATPase [Spirosoma sp. 209]
MYISEISVKGFRNFKDNVISFNDGINVIIGHNNAGKTNLIKALSLVLDQNGGRKLDVDDFYKNIDLDTLKNTPPKIIIELSIKQSNDEDLNSDDLVTVSEWLTNLDEPYEAKLTYEFSLPERMALEYEELLLEAEDINQAWLIIKHDFIRYYTYKIYGGFPEHKTVADASLLKKFDFQFLDAIRDVERDMFTGRNTLLRDVLDFFMDYEIKSNKLKDDKEKKNEIKLKKKLFSDQANILLSNIKERMEHGNKEILSYANETGASFHNATPNFEGSLSDVEIFSALRLIVEYETGIKIPATHNGLGYNNLIFMSLLLAKMQVNSDGNYLGSNAKVFPILAIEEPEAHLHPAMQYKFLKFLRENRDVRKKVRQIFVTTHSTQITAVVALDEIICLYEVNRQVKIGYPGRVFPHSDEGRRAKAYVERFLDATKSDMLFAQKVILVEGLAEQLLISTLAKYIGVSLEDKHIAIINVGGRYFKHFLYLFDTNKSSFAIGKKVVCLTDRDPVRQSAISPNKTFDTCYPFEYNVDMVNYEYRNHAEKFINTYNSTSKNIQFYSQDERFGKTFEYDLILHNPNLKLLITESMSNKNEIISLMDSYERDTLEVLCKILNTSQENSRILDSINQCNWDDNDKKKAIIASRYLNSINKGENALELVYSLEENLKNGMNDFFEVPQYIKDSVIWICS